MKQEPRIYHVRYKVFVREPTRLRLIWARTGHHTAEQVSITVRMFEEELAADHPHVTVAVLDGQTRHFMRDMGKTYPN